MKRTIIEILADMAAWFGETNTFFLNFIVFLTLRNIYCKVNVGIFTGVFLDIGVLSLAEILYWVLRAFTGTAFMDLFSSSGSGAPDS